jgi:FecR-like protein
MPRPAPNRLRSWLLFVLTLIFAGPVAESAAQAPAGWITEIHGSASLERKGRSSAASLELPVMTGDKIETAVESSLTVGLVDGSGLTLSESSSIVIDRAVMDPAISGLASKFFIELFKGTLGSVVTRTIGASPQFEVHTPNAIVGVRGTDFTTKYVEGRPCPGFPQCLRYTDVGVYKGIVQVRNPTSSKPVAVQVTSGYETTVPCELPPAAPGPLGMGDISAPGYH